MLGAKDARESGSDDTHAGTAGSVGLVGSSLAAAEGGQALVTATAPPSAPAELRSSEQRLMSAEVLPLIRIAPPSPERPSTEAGSTADALMVPEPGEGGGSDPEAEL